MWFLPRVAERSDCQLPFLEGHPPFVVLPAGALRDEFALVNMRIVRKRDRLGFRWMFFFENGELSLLVPSLIRRVSVGLNLGYQVLVVLRRKVDGFILIYVLLFGWLV